MKISSLSAFVIIFVLSCFSKATEPERDWTFLIFMNAKNSLDKYSFENLKEMERVGSSDKINVVVQWASLSQSRTVRMKIHKDLNPLSISSPVLEDLGNNVDMGDYKSLIEFINWGVKKFPAKKYFINVWNHGRGWHSSPMDISWDDNTNHFITTEQMGVAMREAAQIIGHKVDIHGNDACSMGMAEVADEMSDSVEIFAGSEELEPAAGWPYDQFLSKWNELPGGGSAIEVAQLLTWEFSKAYKGGSKGDEPMTFSAFDLAQLPRLKRALSNLKDHVLELNSSDKQKVYLSAKETTKFTNNPDYGDLGHFINELGQKNIKAIPVNIINEVKNSLRDLVIANEVTKEYNKVHGVSFWLPIYPGYVLANLKRYRGLRFDQDSGWSDALCFINEGKYLPPEQCQR